MPSLTDVARAAGVSLTTASMVLNKGKQHNRVSVACATRVQEIAREMGYVPNYHARSMKLGKAEVIAVAMDIGHEDEHSRPGLELNNPYFGNLIGGIEMRTRALGYLMTLVGPDKTSRAPDRGLMGIKQRRFDGMIVPGSVLRHDLTSFLTEPVDCPVVVIQPAKPTVHPVVVFDEPAGIDLAVEHLVGLGHRNLLYVGETSVEMHSSVREREFVDACRRAGVAHGTCHSSRVELYDIHHPEAQITRVAADMSEYLAAGKLCATGIVTYNDMTAIGVFEALQRFGISVPGDVSVVGFDDTIARYAVPRLTTVSHKLSEMGQVATNLVMEMVSDPSTIALRRGSRTVIKPELVQRASTGSPPKTK